MQAWFASSPLYIFTPYHEFYFYCRISTTSYPFCQSTTPAHGHLTCLGAIAQLLTTLLRMGQNCDHFNLGILAIKTNIMKSSPLPSSFSGCLTIFPFALYFVHILFYVFSTKCNNCFFTLIFCSQFCLTFLLTMHTLFHSCYLLFAIFLMFFIFQCTFLQPRRPLVVYFIVTPIFLFHMLGQMEERNPYC
jgi:hypothetical protein